MYFLMGGDGVVVRNGGTNVSVEPAASTFCSSTILFSN